MRRPAAKAIMKPQNWNSRPKLLFGLIGIVVLFLIGQFAISVAKWLGNSDAQEEKTANRPAVPVRVAKAEMRTLIRSMTAQGHEQTKSDRRIGSATPR